MQIYDELKKDHDKVKSLLQELLILDEKSPHRHALIDAIRDALVPHSRAEEAVFYNSLRVLDSTNDIIMGSYEEHIEAESLLRGLQLRDKVDMEWRNTAQKLKDALEDHIDEEESKLFALAQQLLTAREAEMLGHAFVQLKPSVQKEGFVKTTFDLLVNLMPPRLAPVLRREGFEPRSQL